MGIEGGLNTRQLATVYGYEAAIDATESPQRKAAADFFAIGGCTS